MEKTLKSKHKSRIRQRKHRRKLAARPYKNYSDEMLEIACEAVISKQISSRDAERQFGIPRRTIVNRIKNQHTNSVGRPTYLTAEEEQGIVKVLRASSDFGSPLTKIDLKLLVHEYLKKNSRDHMFKNKIPGDAWVQSFLARHADELCLRNTQNISQARSEKGAEVIANYFENLKTTLENIPAENIVNFDETNLSDDPGSTKSIFRRGVKYPERIVNSTKGNISLMFTVTASGRSLPLYVVYKASNLYTEWITGGPPETRYNCTKSGWFDSAMFEDYFEKIILPWAQETPGTKVVICDNLSSHLSVKVVELCEQNNIKMAFIPPSTTHLTQPLDVAFFGPLKKAWRQILYEYKVKNPNQSSLNKKHFPKLLRELTEAIKLNEATNIKSGFRASGIFPLNPQEVLKKIPEMQEEILSYSVDQALIDYLKETRSPKPMKTVRNKKVHCEPGKSVTVFDFSATQKTPKKTQIKKNATSLIKRKSHKKLLLDEQTGLFTLNKSNLSDTDPLQDFSSEDIADDLEYQSSDDIEKIILNDDAITEIEKDLMIHNPENLGTICINIINSYINLATQNLTVPIHENNYALLEASTSGNTYPSLAVTYPARPEKTRPPKITVHCSKIIKPASTKADVSLLSSASNTLTNTPFLAMCDTDLPECLKTAKSDDSKRINVIRTGSKWKRVNLKDTLEIDCEVKKQARSNTTVHTIKKKKGNISSVGLRSQGVSKKNLPKKKIKSPKINKRKPSGSLDKDNRGVLKSVTFGKPLSRGLGKRKIKQLYTDCSSTSEDTDTELVTVDSDNSDYETLQDCLIAECLREQEDKENFENNEIPFGMQDIEYFDIFDADDNKLKEDDWVVVRFSTKKSIKHFVGKVLSVDSGIPTVKFVRKVKESKCEEGTTFTYPKVDDVCTISHTEDVVTVLSAPKITRRGQLVFSADFKTFNVQ